MTLRAERQSVRMSKITNDGLTRTPVWHRMLYSCTHMATVGVKGLRRTERRNLNNSVQVRDAVQHRFPRGHVGDVKQVLSDVLIGSLETGLDACRWLIRELDRHLHNRMLINSTVCHVAKRRCSIF